MDSNRLINWLEERRLMELDALKLANNTAGANSVGAGFALGAIEVIDALRAFLEQEGEPQGRLEDL